MNVLKRKLSLLFAVALVIALSISTVSGSLSKSFAAETYSLSINNTGKTEHTFKLYQIFKGSVARIGNNDVLGGVTWGSGIKDSSKTSLGDAEAKAKTLTTTAAAEAFAATLDQHLSTNAKEEVVGAGQTKSIAGLEPGYYLVKDKDNSQAGKESGAYTSYILKVVNNTSVQTKLDVPSVQKKVKDINDSLDTGYGNWQDSADHDINDEIPYQLTGSLPSNFDKYTSYKYKFVDVMSRGLSYVDSSAKVYLVNNNNYAGKIEITSKSAISSTTNSQGQTTLTVQFNDLKKTRNADNGSAISITSNSKIVVEYSAKLNQNAVIGSEGNPNEVYLEYSNNPNNGGSGDVGTTPKDKNIVFTYKVVVNKVNPQNQPLTGAEFTLFKKLKNGSEVEVSKFVPNNSDPTSFTFNGLDDGKYVLRETKVPAGYNKIEDQEFEITAAHDATSDNPALTSLTGTKLGSSVIEFTSVLAQGSLTTNVVNKQGLTLPSTGGMGTTLIYGFGIALVGASSAAIVLKKRKASQR